MSDATRRAIRTLFQFIAGGGLTALVDAVVADISDPRLVALVLAGATLLVSYAQNALEDAGAIPAIGKAPASDGANPIPGDRGQTTFLVPVAILLVLVVFVLLVV